MADGAPVLLFDGHCNLCSGTIDFVLEHEQSDALRFAALQSEVGIALLDDAVGPAEAALLRAGATGSGDPTSLVLVEDGRVTSHSTAALRLVRYLRRPWSWLAVFRIVPRPVRDVVYRWVARNRYRWFGRTETCRVATPRLQARFL